MKAGILSSEYRNCFLVENKGAYSAIEGSFDLKVDLVLTFDFWVKERILSAGGTCEFIDHLSDSETMQENNHRIFDFLRSWHMRPDGSDVFTYQGVSFGMAFRQEIWNDFTFYLRLRANLGIVKKIRYGRLVVLVRQPLLFSALDDLGIKYERSGIPFGDDGYLFPIFKWNEAAMGGKSLKSRARQAFNVLVCAVQGVSRMFCWGAKKKNLFIQEYHPTRKIIERFVDEGRYSVTLMRSSNPNDLGRTLVERLIPSLPMKKEFEDAAQAMLGELKSTVREPLSLVGDDSVTDDLMRVLIERISPSVAEYVRLLSGIIRYFDRAGLDLVVLIANLGIVSSLVDAYRATKGINSFLIINGLLGQDYLDESKYATVINSYSTSIRENYFRGMENVVCLGDPRMDDYAPLFHTRNIDRNCPVVTVGTSGYNPTDLNSYVAVEFDFMHDVMTAFRAVLARGYRMKIVVKVRPNGYKAQYSSFFGEYFPDLEIQIIDNVPMRDILLKTDFYLSIYSQTLFEASTLGIPVLYYKKDTEINQAPFDGRSELVTVYDIAGLTDALEDFYTDSRRFSPFLERETIEKYIGPIDGKNLERNVRFIKRLLEEPAGLDLAPVLAWSETL